MKTYAEKLRDPRWQRKRLEVMQRDNFTCTQCGDSKSTLNIHHWKYNGDPWDAGDDNLSTVCEKCHKTIERIKKEGHPITKDNAAMHILFGYDYSKPIRLQMTVCFLGDVTARLREVKTACPYSLMNDGNTLLTVEICAKQSITIQELNATASSIISDCNDIGGVCSSQVTYKGVTILSFGK